MLDRVEELSSRQNKARALLLKGDLDGVEYREIKLDCETKINALEVKLGDFSKNNVSIESDLNKAIKMLITINGMSSLEDMKLSRELIGSMSP